MEYEAILYEKIPGGKVKCALCAHRCTIAPGRRGVCLVRENRDGSLVSLVYGLIVAENVDPIEKKPLYHFLPGTASYSIAAAGCNMSCSHCQNYNISREAPRMDPIPGRERTPYQIVMGASESGCTSISYTYTEPTVFAEFALDCARESESVGRGLANVFVTNGFMTPEAAEKISVNLDAANVDLKGATDEHYRRVCGGRLEPVLETIRILYGKGVWIEITTLLIPGLNDDDASIDFITSFIASLDPLIPWHVSRFFPTYRMKDRPPTPVESLMRAVDAGRKAGLKYIYVGNVSGEGDVTPCHVCGHPVIIRSGYAVLSNSLTQDNLCPKCSTAFHGIVGSIR